MLFRSNISCIIKTFGRLSTSWICSKSPRYASTNTDKPIPSSARVVICGGGVVGTSVAYHLAKSGWTDVVLLDQGSLTCGTTWHSAGLIGQLGKDDVSGCRLIGYSLQLYKELEKSHGIGWKQCGSLLLAQTKDRFVTIQRKYSLAKALSIDAHLVTPTEIQDLCPWIKTSDLQGGLWIPGDGVLAPNDLVYAYNSVVKSHGTWVVEGVRVEDVLTSHGKVSGVLTSHGPIDCEYFVSCSGQWARHLGQKSTPPVQVPLHSCEHFYIVSSAIKDMDSMMPVIRDYDGSIYAREWSGGILAGGFELEGKPAFTFGVPEKFEFQLLPSDWDHFQVMLDPILNRFPVMETAEVRTLVNGPESFTPDGNWNLGEASEIKNYYVAAGMNGLGVVGSAGIGRHISECIVDGVPSLCLDTHDISRHNKVHGNRRFLYERVKEVIGAYTLHFPYTHWKNGRKLMTSPLHDILLTEGASFGDLQGYERPLYIRNTTGVHVDPYHAEKPSFTRPSWLEDVRDEYRACKDGVCLVDTSCFTKVLIKSKGRTALDYLQHLSCNTVSGKAGDVTRTGMLNARGGYVADCSIATLSSNVYLITATTNHERRLMTWLERHIPLDGSVEVVRNTSSFSSLTIIGPKIEDLMAELCDQTFSTRDFPSLTCKVLDVGFAAGVCVTRLPVSGEDAFTLHIPTEFTLHVYEALEEAGRRHGLRNGGHYVLKQLRLENGIASQEEDITSQTTPLECGKEDFVSFEKKESFIGRQALEVQKRDGISQRIVQLTLTDLHLDHDIWPWGGEPIYRNGQCVGSVTSCGFNFNLEKVVCLGYVDVRPLTNAGHLEHATDATTIYKLDIGSRLYDLDVHEV